MRRMMLVALVLAPVLAVVPASGQARQGPPRPRTPPADIPHVPIARLLAIGKPDLEIGVEDEEGPYLFGQISGLAVGPDGTIYIGDYSVGNVRAFDARGRHLLTFGRRGNGPGEFAWPPAVTHDGDSTIYVPQGPWGVTELTARGGRIAYRRTFGKGDDFSGFCVRGDSLIGNAWRKERILHVLGADRAIQRSFGEAWNSDTNAVVRYHSNRMGARLLCDDPGGAIVAAQASGAHVRTYERDGTLRWAIVLPDYSGAFALAQGRNDGYALVAGEDNTTTLARLDADRLLLQVTRVSFNRQSRSRGPGGMVATTPMRRFTYVLSASTGRILSRSTDAPQLGIIRGPYAYVGIMDPYPHVRRFRVTPLAR